MSKPTIEQLESDIEKLVRAHVEAERMSAVAAVDRAVSSQRHSKPHVARARRTGSRRVAAELEGVAAELYEAVCKSPGETMSAPAPRRGATAMELARPMARLKKSRRVRSVGERHQTRYYPMPAAAEK